MLSSLLSSPENPPLSWNRASNPHSRPKTDPRSLHKLIFAQLGCSPLANRDSRSVYGNVGSIHVRDLHSSAVIDTDFEEEELGSCCPGVLALELGVLRLILLLVGQVLLNLLDSRSDDIIGSVR